jgi:hypothetical protein
MLKYLRNSDSHVHENGFIATGMQALLALAGEASASAHAPYLHPYRQSLHSSYQHGQRHCH